MGQAGFLVLRLEIDHGLAAVAALAMHVLEQMQRQRARAVEQQHVALLQIVEIAAGELSQQTSAADRARRPISPFRLRSPR